MRSLFGREATWNSVERFLDSVVDGSAAFVVEGEAGMGKSAVWLAAMAAADRRGQRVLQARPAESEAALAYSGLTDLVGPVFDEVAGRLPAPQASALGAALLRTASSRPIELRAVATAVISVLDQLASVRPVLVAVDDLQWLDPSSERVLAFVARRLPIRTGLLASRRLVPGAPPSLLLEAIPAERLQRELLQPLSVAALHHLVRERIGISLARPVLTRLATASGGNPLFALEIGRALSRRPEGAGLIEPLPVPSTLHRLVASRVEELSTSARAMLLVVAALSRPTEAALAGVLTVGVSEPALIEAQDADVLVSEHGRLRFTHPLIASVLYGESSAKDRRALHLNLAESVEDPEERARHLAMATEEPSGPVSAELETTAARAAFRGAQDTAADLFGAAERLTPPAAREDRARRVLGNAAALNALGDFAAARASAARALETAGAASPVRTTALLLLGTIAWFDGDAATAITQMEDALAVTARAGGRLGPIHAQLVRVCFSRDFASALEHAQRAEALLTQEDETALLAQVLIDRQFGSAINGLAVPAGLIDRALALEANHRSEDEAPQPMPLLWFHCTDDIEGARNRFSLEERWYRERGEDVWLADRVSHLAVAELRAGHVESAEQHAEAGCAAVEALTLGGPRAMVFEKRALVDAHCGRVERARTTAQELLARFERTDQPWWAALTLSTLAFVEYAAGDGRAADAALIGMRERADRVGVVDVLFDRSEPFHIEVLLELGEVDRAREALQRLEVRGQRLRRPWITAALPRSRALLAAEEGDIVAALAELEAVNLDQAQRLPFEMGWTLLTEGRLQRRAKQKRRASETLEAARDLFANLRAPGFSERADGELARVGLHRAGSELTPTELRIAQLAAGGSTNRVIAQAAFISPKTVEANLARVYRKLGIRSRAELGAHMATQPRDDTPQA